MKEQTEFYRSFDYQPVFRHPSSKRELPPEPVPCLEPEEPIAEAEITDILEELSVSQDIQKETKTYDGLYQRMEDLNDLIYSIEHAQDEKEKEKTFEKIKEESPMFPDSLQSFEHDIDSLIQEVSKEIPTIEPISSQASMSSFVEAQPDKKARVEAIAIPETKEKSSENKESFAFHYDNPNALNVQPSQEQKEADAQIVQQFDYPAIHYLNVHKTLGLSAFPIGVFTGFGASIVYASLSLHLSFQYALQFGMQQWPLILLIAVVFTYLALSIHTGSFLLRNTFGKWPRSMIILCSPFLAILFLIPGVLCELPYVIITMIKNHKEKP